MRLPQMRGGSSALALGLLSAAVLIPVLAFLGWLLAEVRH